MNGVLAYHAKAADENETNRDTADNLQNALNQKMLNLTAVDVDTEMANLQTLQNNYADRKSGVEGRSVSVRVDLGGRRIIKKTKQSRRRHKIEEINHRGDIKRNEKR